MTRLHKIRRATRDISTIEPTTDHSGLFWFKPDRGSPDYYRLVPKEGDGGGYDVWLDTEAFFDKAGMMNVRCEVVLYDTRLHHERERETVFHKVFDGYHQPSEQAFLLNVHHYEQQARDLVDEYAEAAEYWAQTELLGDDRVTA